VIHCFFVPLRLNNAKLTMCNRLREIVSLFFIAVLGITNLNAQTKIAVIADPHVMGPGLLVSDGSAWQSTLKNDRKLLDYSVVIFDLVIDRMLEDKPDLLLIPGDLTKDGEVLSHEYVIKKLDVLREAGVKTLVIPGNHDLGTDFSLYFDGSKTSAAKVVSESKFAELYSAYGYGSGSDRDPNSLSYSCEPIDGLVLIGIDSGFWGEVESSTLKWVCNQAEKAVSEGKQIIAMMHHSVFPHYDEETHVMKNSVVADYETVRNRLVNAGIGVVLTGHNHFSDIAKDFNEDITAQIYDIATGSPISYPCDYRRMTLSADMQELTVTTEHISSLPGEEDFAKTAKQRLYDTMYKWACEDFSSNALIAGLVADMFVAHAEGNENESEDAESIVTTFNTAKMFFGADASMLNMLKKFGLTWEATDIMLNSIMKDISNYGNSERESRVDDLNVTIDLSAIHQPTGIKSVKSTVRVDNDAYYTLQGVRVDNPTKGLYIKNGKIVVVK